MREATAQDYSLSKTHGIKEKTLLFSRFASATMPHQYSEDSGRLTMRRLQLQGTPQILLAVVHAQRRVSNGESSLLLAATDLANTIVTVEQDTGISRTVLVGDLNINPFDPGVSAGGALHAVMTRQLAARGERISGGKSYRFFYNPMSGHFGDRAPGPPGTYRLYSSELHNYHWNMYDQVLLRPELMNSLRELKILDTDGEESLVTRSGAPKKSSASDHLPIFFQLEL